MVEGFRHRSATILFVLRTLFRCPEPRQTLSACRCRLRELNHGGGFGGLGKLQTPKMFAVLSRNYPGPNNCRVKEIRDVHRLHPLKAGKAKQIGFVAMEERGLLGRHVATSQREVRLFQPDENRLLEDE